MSYVSLLKNLPEILTQPTGIAAIASLGIHGAIALIVPLVPVDSNKTKESASSKTVGVMELSQADQNRLPQIPGSSAPINPQSSVLLQQSQIPQMNMGAQSSLPPLPPPPAPSPSQLVLPPIPSSPNNYRISSLPKQQSLRSYSKRDFRFDTSGFNGNSKFSTPPAPRFNNREIALGEAKPLPINKLPVLPEAKLPDGLPTSPAPLPVDATPITPGDVSSTAQTTQPGDHTSTVSQNDQLIARIGTTPQAGDNLSIATQGIPQGKLGATPNISNDLPARGTEKAIAQINSYEELRKTVQQQYPNAVEKSVIRDSITTDKPDMAGLVLGRLVVDPDGKVLDIKFEGQSVSPALQVKAREYFSTHPPKGDKQIAHHPFSLDFKNSSNNAAGDTQKLAPASATTLKPLLNSTVNNSQPVPISGPTLKPLLNPTVNSNQPTPASATTVKPLSNSSINRIQPVPVPATTVKPLPNSLINKLQPVPVPATSIKPLAAPVSTPATSIKPLAVPDTNTSQPTPTVESGKKLIRQLRELKQERQTSN
ncbi:hypothetical protein [Nostoc sp. 106C]|uniref:hypothetical protein n=1 Tax=Nostoc sp. 106C TaxID=1932667 RepID=UPI000A3B81C8|nr:hypothetical protein [Nostoc sp. 106C]OUL22077.1 hypothetical protein BV375_28255 [Nostoc sp. 106C]